MVPTDVPTIRVDAEKCAKDGLCATFCCERIFVAEKGAAPQVRNEAECVLCGHCVAACPKGAIVHSGFAPSRFRRIEDRRPVTPEAAYEFLAQRRSVRVYKAEAPPRELLERIIEVAGYSPSSPHHRVGWVRSFSVVTGREAMRPVVELTAAYTKRLHKLVTGTIVRLASTFDASAKAARAVGDDLTMRLAEWDAGRDAMTYDAPAAIFCLAPVGSSMPQVDCDSAMLSILLLAHAHGLGTCWNGLIQGAAAGDHVHGFTALRDYLKIPADSRCYAAATIGYPRLRLHSVPQRDVSITWIGE